MAYFTKFADFRLAIFFVDGIEQVEGGSQQHRLLTIPVLCGIDFSAEVELGSASDRAVPPWLPRRENRRCWSMPADHVSVLLPLWN
eukprot:scaffold1849_cov163-Ochromonas_danica.AAC.1